VVPRLAAAVQSPRRATPLPEPCAEPPAEVPAAVVAPGKVQKSPAVRLLSPGFSGYQSPLLQRSESPTEAQGPPFTLGRSRTWAYLHRRNSPINFSDPTGFEPASVVYSSIYSQVSNGQNVIRESGNAYLSIGGGLHRLIHIMLEVSNRVDKSSQFLDVVQALFIPNSAIRAWASQTGFVQQSPLQGNNYAISTGMIGWHRSWNDARVPGQDQAHHFLAFVVAGFNLGLSEAMAASLALDAWQPNIPDVHLGYLGGQYGDLLNHKSTGCKEADRRYRSHWLRALQDRLGAPDPFNGI